MLVTMKEVLELCEEKKCAVGSFNTPNLESVMAVIAAAEELVVPVMIQHAEVHESIMPMEVIGPVMLEMAKKASVPVVVHLDHGESVEYVKKALEIGFTSVMYDGSVLSFEENAENTKRVVAMAKETGASVEAEIGCMGKRESGSGEADAANDPEKIYTDPDLAKEFVEMTGIDALACSFGTTHGVYISEPKLDLSVVEKVREKTNIPVVMHGGSGVSKEDFQTAIEKGVRKVNYYTYMAIAGGECIAGKFRKGGELEKEQIPVMFHDIAYWATDAMKENCKQAMEVFAMR